MFTLMCTTAPAAIARTSGLGFSWLRCDGHVTHLNQLRLPNFPAGYASRD